MDGYVAVRRVLTQRTEEYTTACVPSETCHNERDTWMLFRLLPAEFILSDYGTCEDVASPKLKQTLCKIQEVEGGGGVVKSKSDSVGIEMHKLLPHNQE